MDSSMALEMMKAIFVENEPGKAKQLVASFMNALMKVEREQHIGAKEYERTEGRNGYRSGYKPRQMRGRLGSLELLVPQVRGSSVPFRTEMFERYQRSEKALLLAVAQMYFKGVSTRGICDLYRDVFEAEMSPQFVSNAAKELDEQIAAWRAEELSEAMPYLIVDALYKKVRKDNRIVSEAVLIVLGITAAGKRRVLDFAIADSENEETYRDLFQRLKDRGLHGVRFIISDAHKGLMAAIGREFQGATWQRCKVHFIRDYATHLSVKKTKTRFYELMKALYAVKSKEEARPIAEGIATFLKESGHPKLAARLLDEYEETFQYLNEPEHARRRLSSSNLLERQNSELKRRLHAIRIFPNDESLARLVGMLLMELDEEWRFGRTYLSMDGNEDAE